MIEYDEIKYHVTRRNMIQLDEMGIDAYTVLIDIIEKQKTHIKKGAHYQTHTHDCQGGKGYLAAPGEIDVTDCTCGYDEYEQDGKKIFALMGEPDNETLRKDLGTFDIDTTPDELQRQREE